MPPVPQAEQHSKNDIPEGQRAGYAEGYEQGKTGLTREPTQPGDPEFMAGHDLGWADGATGFGSPPPAPGGR